MRLTTLFVFLALLTQAQIANAFQLQASAYGETPEQARKNALASLSESIYVEVKSTFTSKQSSDGTQTASNVIRSNSDLPLLGVDFEIIDKKSEQYCIALLDSKKSLKLYQAELARLTSVITQANNKQKALKNNKNGRYRLLSALITDIEQYSKYRAVASLLGGGAVPSLPVTATDIRNELLSIESSAPSLEIAAEVLTRDLPDKIFYVLPPLPQGSKQATDLSRILMNQVASKITAAEKAVNSELVLRGSYEILNDGLSVTYRAIGSNGLILATRIVMLAEQAYENIDYKPTDIGFEDILNKRDFISHEFHAELNSNQGKSDLLFFRGDSIELFTKLNQPGYFYVVGHNTKDNISYLLELNNASNNRAFVRYINADDANRWVRLDVFEVTPPYGAESLQLIASSQDLADKLPASKYDSKTGLYLIKAATTSEAVQLTRALKLKKTARTKSSEATLTFTTMDYRN